MKEVRKKSVDEAVNQMLLNAYRCHIPLAWDRAENMQPQCGFGKVSICCGDCYEGPCRVNPFDHEDRQTICGRNKQDLAAGDVLKKVKDGVAGLLKLEHDFGLLPDTRALLETITADDEMLLPEDYTNQFVSLGQSAITILRNIRKLKTETYGLAQQDVIGANLGVLEAGAANIVLHGHLAPAIVAGIVKAAEDAAIPVNVVSLCGSEAAGGTLPVASNYDSQETALLTGVVDLLLLGNQCVMPSTTKLAGELGIQTYSAAKLTALSDFAAIVAKAELSFRAREGKAVAIPPIKNEVYVGFTAGNSPQLFAVLSQDQVKGIVYLGGCGNIANTQDADFIKIAKDFIAQGYLVVSAGCAGTALAKAGLCHPEYNTGSYPLHGVLPEGTPPVLYLGSCHDAGEFLTMVQTIGKTPVIAIFSELSHNKVLATAIGFAVAGITTYLGLDCAFADGEIVGNADAGIFAKTGARVLPLTELKEISCILAEAAASK